MFRSDERVPLRVRIFALDAIKHAFRAVPTEIVVADGPTTITRQDTLNDLTCAYRPAYLGRLFGVHRREPIHRPCVANRPALDVVGVKRLEPLDVSRSFHSSLLELVDRIDRLLFERTDDPRSVTQLSSHFEQIADIELDAFTSR